ncbi:MAG: DUF3137 domain-containing protein [Desulfobacteraceae bacterium]|nr:DUF3137 domain-containing protein [Desulfobacteraceae bacterium]
MFYLLLTKNYRVKYKNKIISKGLGYLCNKYKYCPKLGLPKLLFHTSLLCTSYSEDAQFSSNDYIILEDDANSIAFSEICFYRPNIASNFTYKYFKGLLGIVPIGEKYHDPIVIKTKNPFAPYLKGDSIFLTDKNLAKKIGKLKKVFLDDEDFETQFEVYTNNKKYAKETLTPKVRQCLLKIAVQSELFIEFSFHMGIFFIGISKIENLFNPPPIMFSPVTKAFILSDFKLLKIMFSIIETLNIDVNENEKMSIQKIEQEIMRL